MRFDLTTVWQVNGILKSSGKTCIYNSDLYVDCTEQQAQTILRLLTDQRDYGTIELTTEGCEQGEYRFRIIA